jgi:hypothetical protein
VEVVVGVGLLAVVLALVLSPLRPGRAAGRATSGTADREALEAARDAKYREIREAELDFRTGKLSDADYRQLDRTLRREAIELLRRLDDLP